MVKTFFKGLYTFAVYVFLYAPLIITIVFSFNKSRYSVAWEGFTTQWYGKMIQNTGLLDSAINSLFLAATAATVATVIGTVTAVALHRYRFIGQKVVYGSLSVIMMSPEIIMAISLVMLFVILGIPLGFTTLLCFAFLS